MKLYTAKIRIKGSLEHEVVKHQLTAAEIAMLSHIHGGNHPPVVDIVHTANVNRSDAKERARLAEAYTSGELTSDNGARIVNGLFGVNGPLPQDYVVPTFEAVETVTPLDDSKETITPVDIPVRTKIKDDPESVVG